MPQILPMVSDYFVFGGSHEKCSISWSLIWCEFGVCGRIWVFSDARIRGRANFAGSHTVPPAAATEFERQYLRFEGVVGVDLIFDDFTLSPRVTSHGYNTAIASPAPEKDNELAWTLDATFGNWTVALGDVQGRPLPLPSGLQMHTVIESRAIHAIWANRHDGQVENFAPISGYYDNTRQSSSGKLAVAHDEANWFVRGIYDLGVLEDYDEVADVNVARQYLRLEGGYSGSAETFDYQLGAAVWSQDSYENSSGRIVDPALLTKAGRWGDGAVGFEIGGAADFGDLDVGLSATVIRGPYSNSIAQSGPDDIRAAAHLTGSYQFNDDWSVAGALSTYTWELSAGGPNTVTGALVQLGVEWEPIDNFSVGLGYVFGSSTGVNAGGSVTSTMGVPTIGAQFAF